MLIREKVIFALEEKRSHFAEYVTAQRDQRRKFDERLHEFFKLDAAEIQQRLALIPWPGALPTEEYDQAKRLRIPFGQSWQNHSESRNWALEVLRNRTVIAVDGSQITPTKDVAPPIAAIQIGWFINHHQEGGSYEKDVEFDVLTPADFESEDEEGDLFSAVSVVNQVRFERECEKLAALMEEFSTASEKPLCIFDGSFIISFAGQLQSNDSRLRSYLQRITHLLRRSQELEVPLVAFVDSSLSHDVTTMIRHSVDMQQVAKQTDGELLSPPLQAQNDGKQRALLPQWGDRTPFFWCARNDLLSSNAKTTEMAEYYRDVAFCYIQFAMDRPPARLEIPGWLFKSGRGEEIANLLRAESVVGSGYPYAIETADALAVISMQDRERFYGLFQQYLKGHEIEMTQARKARSKLARR